MRIVSCGIVFALFLSGAVAGGERTARFPFYGDQPLGQSNDVAFVRNSAKLVLGTNGVLIGKGHEAPEVMLPGWRGEQGTAAFWIKAVDWDARTKEHVVLVGPIAPSGGVFVLYKYMDVDKIWFFGELPTTPPQARQVNSNFAYDGLKGWKKGEWHHIGFAWKKGRFARLYIDGVLASTAEGSFLFPDSMKGLVFGTAGVGSMGENVQSVIRDLYVTPGLMSDSEIGLLARNRPDAGEGPNQPSLPQTVNVFAFPQAKQPPKIDGKIEPDEYPGLFSGFIAVDTHVIYPEKTQFGAAADNESICVAAAVKLPGGLALNSASNSRDDPAQVAKGDLFCLIICPDAKTDKKAFSGVYLTVAPNGNIYDAQEDINWETFSCLRKKEFNAVIETASLVSNGVWVVELKIARKSLGLPKNDPFAFVAGFQVGGSRIALQDHPVWFDHYQAFSRGVFTPLGMQVDFGKLSEGRVNLALSLWNRGDAAVSGRAALKVGLPLIKETAAGMVVEQKIGQEVKVEMREVLQAWQEPFALKPGGQVDLKKEANLSEPNTYALTAEVNAGDTVICRQQLPFVYASPVEVELKPVPSKDSIKAQLSFYGVDRAKLGGGKIELAFVSAESKKEALKERFPVSGPSETVTFSMRKLPPGIYDVAASLSDKDGLSLGRRSIKFEKRAEPEWLKHPKGIEALEPDWVPAPWEEMKVSEVRGQRSEVRDQKSDGAEASDSGNRQSAIGNRKYTSVSVWGRAFEFSEGSLLAGIVSQEKPVLAAGVTVKYVVQGQEKSFEIGKAKVKAKGKGLVQVVQKGTAPDFKMTATHRIEFDGMDRLDIAITPVGHAKIERLWVEIPMTNVSLEVFTSAAGWAWWPDSRDFTCLPHLWFGNDKAGCSFFAESCKGWMIDSKKPRVTLKAVGETSIIRYCIVNDPSEIAAPLEFTLGLQPTPVKPYFKNWHAIRAQGWGWTLPPTSLFMTDPRSWMSSYAVPAPRNWKCLEDMVAQGHENKQTVYPYLPPFTISLYDIVKRDTPYLLPGMPMPKGAWFTNAKDSQKIEDYWYYAEDWSLSPPQFNSDGLGDETSQMACLSPSGTWADYFAGGVEEILRRSDVDGFYFDLPMSLQNFDETKGLAYTTKDGVREGATEYFAMRDLYKRLHWLFEKYRGPARKPYILGHGFPSDAPISSFWDVNFHGEGLKPSSKFEYTRWFLQNRLEGSPMVKPAAPDAPRNFDAPAYRATQGLQFGIPILYLPQYAIRPELDINEHSRELLSWTFPHNTLLWPGYIPPQPVYDFWTKVEIPFGMGDTVFYPYWENGIATKPECIRVSYWKKETAEDYLVAVANWSDKAVDATIALPAVLAAFPKCLDMEKSETLAVSQNWPVTVPAHDLRVFRFGGKK